LDDIPKTLTNNEKKSLIELSCDESLKIEFTKLELGEFWIKIKNDNPLLSKKALSFFTIHNHLSLRNWILLNDQSKKQVS